MAVEPERVHLEDGGTLGANVLDGGAADAHGVLDVLAVGEDAGDAVVLTLVENLLVGGDVLGEGVDGAAVVDDDEEDGEVLLGGGVEALGHPPVLRAALAHEHHRDAILRLPVPRCLSSAMDRAAPTAYGSCSATSAHPPWKLVSMS